VSLGCAAVTLFFVSTHALTCLSFCSSFHSTGDSGGPLLNADGVQVGVVSWSIKPCGTPGYPDVFSRVSAEFDWIKETACELTSTNTKFCKNKKSMKSKKRKERMKGKKQMKGLTEVSDGSTFRYLDLSWPMKCLLPTAIINRPHVVNSNAYQSYRRLHQLS
jgi:secreted trypsin-like serine protease